MEGINHIYRSRTACAEATITPRLRVIKDKIYNTYTPYITPSSLRDSPTRNRNAN